MYYHILFTLTYFPLKTVVLTIQKFIADWMNTHTLMKVKVQKKIYSSLLMRNQSKCSILKHIEFIYTLHAIIFFQMYTHRLDH